MAYSNFSRYYKCAQMLSAQEALGAIQASSFSSLKPTARDKLWGSLKRNATWFLTKEVKDFKDVVSNLAKRLSNG